MKHRDFVSTCIALALAVPFAIGQDRRDGLADLSQRLRAGDLAAIDELLARTKPASIDLAGSSARIAQLRAEIERLDARRAARPIRPPTPEVVLRRPDSEGADVVPRADALRESAAWLRANEPERALQALPVAKAGAPGEDDALYLEARALEKLGRRAEALESYRRLATSAASPVLRARAAGDAAHVTWRERMLAREGRP